MGEKPDNSQAIEADMRLTYGSLFSGIGAFDLGFDRAGLSCAWQAEKDQKARDVLKNHWPDVPKYEDVKNVGRRNLAPVDLICGGFPCQDVSVAGRREGLAGEQSGLWFEFRRIIAELGPQWVVIENVPGLLSSTGGRDMGAIVGGLGELGYWWAYRVLDAQFWGVPQRRRRVFIVASLTKGCPQEVLFERQSSPWDTPPSRETGAELAKNVAATIRSGGKGGIPSARADGVGLTCFAPEASGNTGLNIRNDLSGTLQENQRMAVAFGGNSQGPVSVATSCNAHGRRLDFESETFICNTFNGYTGGPDDNDAQGRHIVWNNGQGDPNAEISDVSYCINGQVNQGVGARRLTPVECERLQGFPDGWTAGLSDSARYRLLGNAVAVPVAEWLGKRLKNLF